MMVWLIFMVHFSGLNVAPVSEEPVTPQEIWTQANLDYKEGRYSEAFEQYHSLYQSDIQNGVLLFNMGNACYKLGKLGPAILYYEKALVFIPRDIDLIHNLDRALHARAKAKSDPNDDQMTERIRNLFFSVSYGFVFWITAGLLLVVCFGWFFIFWKGARAQIRATVSTLSVLSLLLLGFTSYHYHLRTTHDRGVILVVEESVRSGPSKREDVSFTIYEGKRVTILARTPGWLRIRLNNGYNGWVHETAVGII